MKKNYEQAALLFRALSDPNRLAIIDMIKTEEKCACKILEELQITQPTLSHHMKILCDSGLVNSRREGKWMHYSINKELFEEVKQLFDF
ncbi:MAG: winged helix-turn-helix transcriptional regulator [Tissierellia bacterium]|nr:winged helix-turn-helix transcriptional regulator [Sedimentibacter sp.]NLA14227.1 winged helix-turn-helix transcriptional regulator [Tissierellia bacterium]HOA18921.1 metalloregulator ArsR/SmtB family transcription factor [Sedimentibacter sp.]HOG62657.1 metalloregulator ArsR/SmtB family transcription factor [Sedimentibacter sp.]HOT22704.1 metalloregulator ArsR/SmtB family transcription factor [Sedimentibacter sp.]